jgi:hypothetical protein
MDREEETEYEEFTPEQEIQQKIDRLLNTKKKEVKKFNNNPPMRDQGRNNTNQDGPKMANGQTNGKKRGNTPDQNTIAAGFAVNSRAGLSQT